MHSNGQLRTERDEKKEKECQKPALQQKTTDDDDDVNMLQHCWLGDKRSIHPAKIVSVGVLVVI